MLVNGRVAWNMSAGIDGNKQKGEQCLLTIYVTEKMLNWVDLLVM